MATVYFNTYVSHLVSRAESSKHVEHVNPYYTTLFDVWHFEARNCFLRCGGWGVGGGGSLRGLRYLKRCLQALPFPLSAVFLSLVFHRSLVFFALPHWPRAWHRVLYSYFERNLDSADKSSRKQCDVMMTTHHVIVSIKLCLDVGNDEYIILLHSPWHAGPHLTPNYSDVTVAMNPCTLPYKVPISTSSKSYNLYGMLLLSSVQSAANTTTSL